MNEKEERERQIESERDGYTERREGGGVESKRRKERKARKYRIGVKNEYVH